MHAHIKNYQERRHDKYLFAFLQSVKIYEVWSMKYEVC